MRSPTSDGGMNQEGCERRNTRLLRVFSGETGSSSHHTTGRVGCSLVSMKHFDPRLCNSLSMSRMHSSLWCRYCASLHGFRLSTHPPMPEIPQILWISFHPPWLVAVFASKYPAAAPTRRITVSDLIGSTAEDDLQGDENLE